ncbi:hypothetical protein NC797_06915 [Aquibacillus sp. 3ASR75-11]|uniref:Uncharacterized protein n=1 Tax=Terrihalobacillus insolitus TaxID=2950438 RepID=A0A9X4AN81_9BACI|nr:hypothetical protein [Terrihalobacillus insolitus]MDC3424238.1 hypothetical protein [Terrihalobacillus insolitus]
MTNLNPMFSKMRKKKTYNIPHEYLNQPRSKRKERSDKKKDIKVPVSLGEKKQLKLLGYSQKLSSTQFASVLVEDSISRPYIEFLMAEEYPEEKYYVHVKLSKEKHREVVRLSAEWDCSIRQATHRILVNVLRQERGGAV